MFESNVCCSVYSPLDCEFGFLAEFLWLTRAISAESDSVAPCLSKSAAQSVVLHLAPKQILWATHRSMYSLPALPNNRGALGPLATSRVFSCIRFVVPIGGSRSRKKLGRLPGFIFPNPTTITQSAAPCETIVSAIRSPVDSVEQLLFTL